MQLAVVAACFLSLLAVTNGFRMPCFQKPHKFAGPKFCRGLECPAYHVESALSRDTELRSYSKVSWISTVVDSPSLDAAMNVGFMRLYDYIAGKNSDKVSIDMTAPVRVMLNQNQLFAPSNNNSYTISFFMSPNYTKENPAPTPSDSRIFFESEGATDYFVKSYGGWSTELVLEQKASDLVDQLKDLGMTYDDSSIWFAGYDSPFRLFNRHNEVWVKAKTMMVQ